MQPWARTPLTAVLCILSAFFITATRSHAALDDAQQFELQTLLGQLNDPQREPQTRREAAELLLTRSYPNAADALYELLLDAGNRPAQLAIAEAIARVATADERFIPPLMSMLTGAEPSLRLPAGRALVSFRSDKVTRRLMELATDPTGEPAVRVAVVQSLQRVPHREVAGALVALLDDPQRGVRQAAGEALIAMTGQRAHGQDARQWRAWWDRHRDRSEVEWLTLLAEGLARDRTALEGDNARLRDRLARAMQDVHALTPPAQRDALLLRMLRDELPDVRLSGTGIVRRRVEAHEMIPRDIQDHAWSMLNDPEPRVRQAAALLLANFADDRTIEPLLQRLRDEPHPGVRQAILRTLGQLRRVDSLPDLLAALDSQDSAVGIAAADALGRLAGTHQLAGEDLERAVTLLVRQHDANGRQPGDAAWQEALLRAMGQTGDRRVLPVLRHALQDAAATVRLSAIDALARIAQPDCAEHIEPLLGDPDRGVRQAAIAALARTGGLEHLQAIFHRIHPHVEADVRVRDDAWQTSLSLLREAPAEVIAAYIDLLNESPNDTPRRIELMQIHVAVLQKTDAPGLPQALRSLGRALLDANQPAQATPVLERAYARSRSSDPLNAPAIWTDWLQALLLSDDPGCARAIAEQEDAAIRAQGLVAMEARLVQLAQREDWTTYRALGDAALVQLAGRLDADARRRLTEQIAHARQQQLEGDRRTVAGLIGALGNADATARDDAMTQIRAMGDRAVRPVLEELHRATRATPAQPQLEQSLGELLRALAPGLTGYDPAAPREQRLRWLVDAMAAD